MTTALVSAQTGSPTYLGALNLRPGVTAALCLTAASDADGAVVTTENCNGAANQKWTFAGGAIHIFNNKCLDVKDGNNTNGAKLQIWTCGSGSANQAFFYNFWNNQLSWTNMGKCVDLSGGRTTTGNAIQIWNCNGGSNQVWNSGYQWNQQPSKSQNGQLGNNNCAGANSQSSMCQTAWINSLNDFCLWAPHVPGSVGNMERNVVAWCTNTQRGTRSIPNGALTGVHFVKTSKYVQITGTGDFTKMNIPNGDDGGELDPHGPDGNGNPVGGLLYGSGFGTNQQYHEWNSFISHREFCIRACVGVDAHKYCNNIYDVMGCWWNMPGNYNSGQFETCDADLYEAPGVYGTSTWHQGTNPTPPPHPVPASSNCVSQPTVTAGLARRGLAELLQARDATPTPAPA